MKLSVIIVNYNTKDLTLACINSIKKYPPTGEYEIVVVDNGSVDGSVEALSGLADNSRIIRFINAKENLGFARGNNLGIKNSSGRYKLLLNSDTEVIKGSIDKLLDFAKKTKDAGAAAPRLLNSDGTIQPSVFPFPTVKDTVRQWWFGKKGLLDKYYPEGKKPVVVDIAVMSAFLITPKGFKKVGLLDERYFMFYEDFDYCRRIHEAGLRVYYFPESEIIHHHGASGISVASENKQWYRLLHGSRIYHGLLKHYLIYLITRSSDVFQRRVLNILK